MFTCSAHLYYSNMFDSVSLCNEAEDADPVLGLMFVFDDRGFPYFFRASIQISKLRFGLSP